MSLIPFAYSIQLKKLVDVSDVPSGLSCKCLCPSCNMKLLAKKGEINEHHFSHFDKALNDCSYSYWVSVRDMAKQILEASSYIKMRLNSISMLQLPPHSPQSNCINIFNIKRAQENDYLANTSVGKIKIYISTPEHKKFSQLMKKDNFEDEIILNIQLHYYKNSTKSALKQLIISDTSSKAFLLPRHRIRDQDESYIDEDTFHEEDIREILYLEPNNTGEEEILQKLYLNKNSILSGALYTIRKMKGFYFESVLKCSGIKPTIAFDIVRSNGFIHYVSYKENFFAITQISIYHIVYIYSGNDFVRIANTSNPENVYLAMDKYINELDEANLVF